MRWFGTLVAVLAMGMLPGAFRGQPALGETFITAVSTVTETACPKTVTSDDSGTTVTTSKCAIGKAQVGCVRDHAAFGSNRTTNDECTVAVGASSLTCHRRTAGGNGYGWGDEHCSANGREVCGEEYDLTPGSPATQHCDVGQAHEGCVDQAVDPGLQPGFVTTSCTAAVNQRACTIVVDWQYGQITGVDLARTGCRLI
jgi:hypothetical protein